MAIQDSKTLSAIKLAIFLVIIVAEIVFGWTLLMRQMNEMVDNIKGIVLIVSFSKIDKNNPMKDEVVKTAII